mmetsp:Transcript_21474/g.24677  ORF Transcript_21474/g.24677 Transcript_21474/m.24677 type:complete len:243 (-) Transcript_21474:192-920(-)
MPFSVARCFFFASLIAANSVLIALSFGFSLIAAFRSSRAVSNSFKCRFAVPLKNSAFTLAGSISSAAVVAFTTSGHFSIFFVTVAMLSWRSLTASFASGLLASSRSSKSIIASRYFASALKRSFFLKSSLPSALHFMAFSSLCSSVRSAKSSFSLPSPSVFSPTLTSSTSKISVAPPGIVGGEPDFPYPYSLLIVSRAFSPVFMERMPRSQPLMTMPVPTLNCKGSRLYEQSNSVPSSRVPR